MGRSSRMALAHIDETSPPRMTVIPVMELRQTRGRALHLLIPERGRKASAALNADNADTESWSRRHVHKMTYGNTKQGPLDGSPSVLPTINDQDETHVCRGQAEKHVFNRN